MKNELRLSRLFVLAFGLVLALAPLALAQDTTGSNTQDTTNTGASATTATNTNAGTQTRSAQSGQKMKIKGVVTRRDADTFVVRDANGVDTTVRLTDQTSVKTKGGFLRSGTNYGQTSILRGLNLEVEGRTNESGQLVASKIRFNDSDYRVAQTVESRVNPVENRVSTAENRIGEVEQNAQRLS